MVSPRDGDVGLVVSEVMGTAGVCHCVGMGRLWAGGDMKPLGGGAQDGHPADRGRATRAALSPLHGDGGDRGSGTDGQQGTVSPHGDTP